MILLSNEFRQALWRGDRQYKIWADITLLDQTSLHLTEEDLWSGGLVIEDAVSDDSSFQALGSTVINQAKLTLNNVDERFSRYDFNFAEVVLYVGMVFGGRTEKIKKGVYQVEEATYTGGLINLTCLDNMAGFEADYSSSALTYPATLSQIVQEACTSCGVLLQTIAFPQNNFVVQTRPSDEAVTYRQVIGWAAAVAGCFARCNKEGRLELKWFDQAALEDLRSDIDGGIFDSTTSASYQSGSSLDGGAFAPWQDGPDKDQGNFLDADQRSIHYLNRCYSQEISVDDVVVTGVEITVQESTDTGQRDHTYFSGSRGYTISVSGNPFLTTENGASVCSRLASQLVGLTFRKANVSHANSPAIEAGDIALVWDQKQRQYPILVTRTSFSPTGAQTTISASETPSRNSASRYSAASKAYVDARKLLKKEMSARDQQLALLASQLSEKSGLYSTTEAVQSGSIYYLHDKPQLNDSTIVWKMTANAWGVSTNGGQTWNAGLTVDGNLIASILTADGVNADWINAGCLQIKNSSNREIFYANVATGQVRLKGWNGSTETMSLDSSTGILNITKGSINLGDGKFSVTNAGVLSCSGAEIHGEVTSGTYGDGSWIRLATNGQIQTGYDSDTTGAICSNPFYVGGQYYSGLRIQGSGIILNADKLAVTDTSDTLSARHIAFTGSCRCVYIPGSGQWSLDDVSSHTLKFINGICVDGPQS